MGFEYFNDSADIIESFNDIIFFSNTPFPFLIPFVSFFGSSFCLVFLFWDLSYFRSTAFQL